MNLIKNKYFLIALLVLAAAFLFFKGKDLYERYFNSYKTDENGLIYKFLEGDEAKMPFNSEYKMLIRYALIGPAGDTIINSFAADTATEANYPDFGSNIILAALRKMTEHSLMEVLVETDSMKRQFGNNRGLKNYDQLMEMPNGRYAKFVIEVGEIMDAHEFEVFRNKKLIFRVTAEADAIYGYCDSLKQKYILSSENHFRYYKEVSTKNDTPRIGDKVSFNVEVTKFNGAPHMSTVMEGKKFVTTLGQANHPLRALQVLPLHTAYGETITYVVPSYLAYDAAGSYGVAPYEPLVIKIWDLTKIK